MSSVRSAVAAALAAPVLLLLAASAGPADAQGGTVQGGTGQSGTGQSGAPRGAAGQDGTASRDSTAPRGGAAAGDGAAPRNGAAANGTYYVRDAATGRCLAGTRVATCGTGGTEWTLRNHADGTVQFQEVALTGRCLSLPEALSYPAAVLMNACESALSTDASVNASTDTAVGQGTTDRWRIEGFVDGPVTIAHAYPPAGRLAVQDSAVRVSNNSSALWVLIPVLV